MGADHADASDLEERVDEVIAEYLRAVEAGRAPDRAEFLAQHPELVPQLEAFFADQDQAESWARPLRALVPPGLWGRRVACPHCRHTLEVLAAADTEVVCPACGSGIRLEPEGPAPLAGRRTLGRFELLGPVGVGAFGTVYKARDPALDRVVAVKVPRAGHLASGEDLDRFLREGRSLAQLHHPGIVPVYEVGQADSVPYLVAEFIEGQTLAETLRTRRPTPHEAAWLLAQVADALQYAHERGVIHRDLKPSNILLAVDGGRWTVDSGRGVNDREWTSKEKDHDSARLSVARGVAAGDGPGDGHLPTHGQVPTGGNVRPDQPATPSCGVGSLQHRRGPGATHDQGVSPSPLNRPGIAPGGSNPSRDRPATELPDSPFDRRAEPADHDRSASAQRPDERPGTQTQFLTPPPPTGHRSPSTLLPLSTVHHPLSTFLPKITDFGLAKREFETTMTQEGQVLGTPAYMSPEQAAGEAHRVDGRSDVYSLGVILYEMLTGEVPFRGSARMLLYQVLHDEPRAPRSLNDRLPRDLDTICLKCLHKEPHRRYVTAEALADDLRRFLSGQPIQARPVGTAERTWRWCRRNPLPATLLAGIAFALLAGIATSSYFAWTAAARAKEAEENAEAANRQTDLARQNLRKARQAVDEYFTLVSEGTLLEDPAQEPLRKQLLQAALRYYEGFVQQQGDDPELRAELAAAYFRIGSILMALGPEVDWLPPFQKGVAVLEELVRQKPDVTTLQSLQSGIYQPRSAMVTVRQPAETFRTFVKGRAVWEELVRDHPTIAGFRSDLAAWHAGIALMHSLNEQPEEAARCYQRACDLREDLLATAPGTSRYSAALVISLNELGKQLTKLGQLPRAKMASRRALELAQKLVRDFPEVPAHQELLAEVHAKLGQGYGHAGQPDDVEEARRQTLAGYERLAQAFPRVPRYQTERFRAQWAVGNLLWDSGRRAEAEEAYRRVTALGERLNAEDPQHQEPLAWFLATCWDPQLRDARRAVALAQEVVKRNGRGLTNFRVAPQHGTAWNTLGIAHYRAGDWAAAIVALEKSMALRQGGDCCDWLFLAMAHWQQGERERASGWYDRAARWMDQHAPKNEEWRHFRAEAEELLEIKRAP